MWLGILAFPFLFAMAAVMATEHLESRHRPR
jgi:hypothetical protein